MLRRMMIAGGGTSLPFTPAALAPFLWYNDDSSVTDAFGGQCSQWNDISGNGYHLDQGSSSTYPLIQNAALNGRRTIKFDGINDSMRNNSTGARAVFQNQGYGWCFSVYKKNSTDGGATTRAIFSATNGTTGDTRFVALCGNNANQAAVFARRQDGDGTAVFNDTTSRSGTWVMQLWAVDWTNGDAFLYTDGVLAASTSSLTSNGSTSNTVSARALVVGGYPLGTGVTSATNCADVDIAELIISRGAPSAEDIDKLFGYAAHRWGLTGNLASDHPYKTAPPTLVTVGDPYFGDVSALLPMTGADGSTTFADIIGNTWTPSGNAQIDTAIKPFGTGAMLLDGTGDFIQAPSSAGFGFGAGLYTMECMIYGTNPAGVVGSVFDTRTASNTGIQLFFGGGAYGLPSNTIGCSSNTGVLQNAGSGVVSSNTWYHLAIVRDAGNLLRVYLNGVQKFTVTDARTYASSSTCFIGSDAFGTALQRFPGSISSVRITKGVCRYPSGVSFTPPSGPFPTS